MKSAKKPKGTKERFNGKYRLASTMEQPLAYFFVLLIEGYVLLVVTAVTFVALGAERPYSGAVFTAAFIIFIQTIELRAVRKTPRYILYLLRRATTPPSDESSDFSYNILLLKGSLRGIVSLGNDHSGNHFRNLLSMTLVKRDSSIPLSLTTDQVTTAIELSIVDEASKMPIGRIQEPFVGFSSAVRSALDPEAFTVSDLCHFTANCYLSTSPTVKECARAVHESARLSTTELARLKIWAQLVGAIAAIVSGADTMASWIPL